jgi:hypothetical protein
MGYMQRAEHIQNCLANGKSQGSAADNHFFLDAIEVVKLAVEADNTQDYEAALPLYLRALNLFMSGLKCENNPTGMEF